MLPLFAPVVDMNLILLFYSNMRKEILKQIKLLKLENARVAFVADRNHILLLSKKVEKQTKTKTKLTKEDKFQKPSKRKNNPFWPMSKLLWCDVNQNSNLLKKQDMCPNPKCKCQKQLAFTPKEFGLEGAGFRNTTKKFFKGSEKAWNSFLKPAVNVAAPFIGMPVGAKTKNLRLVKLRQIF